MNANVDLNRKGITPFLRTLAARRRLILMAGILVITIGLFLKRDWLIAAGIAPALIGLLPCAAMCALGLCMGGMKKGNGNSGGQAGEPDQHGSPSKQEE